MNDSTVNGSTLDEVFEENPKEDGIIAEKK